VNRAWRLVDLPGYGFAQVARENQARFNKAVNDYLVNRPNLAGVFVLIDSQHSPQKIDLEFVHWFGGQSVPLVLVFTKTDKLQPAQVQRNIALFQEEISDWFEAPPEVFNCSSVTGRGLPQLLEVMDAMLATS
jgi:GTP-binding protein